jgi:hypothetical protein
VFAWKLCTWNTLVVTFGTTLVFALLIAVTRLLTAIKVQWGKNTLKQDKTIAFFHPYADACGGGEKVLF